MEAAAIRFLDDPREVLDAVGAQAVSYAQRSFERQSFGQERWMPRYPFQKSPKLNVAGALADFKLGRSKPLDRRFRDAPALVDTGALRNSLAHAVKADGRGSFVEIGSSLPYAARMLYGGESRQTISDTDKAAIKRWLGTRQGIEYADKMAPLLEKDELVTEVVARPFLGVNAEFERLLARTIEIEVNGQ